MTYDEAIRDLNRAAYTALRTGGDTTALPEIDRWALRLICAETDRLVDQGVRSGLTENSCLSKFHRENQ